MLELLTTFSSKLFHKKEKSIILVIYLLLKNKGKDNDFEPHLKEILKILYYDVEIVNYPINDLDDLRAAFAEPKSLGRIVKRGIELNEPEIAIMAGEDLLAKEFIS